MDNQYPLCNGEYRDVIDGILSNFTIDSFIGTVTRTNPKQESDINVKNGVRTQSIPGAFANTTPSTYHRVDVLRRVSGICDYITLILSDSERAEMTKMLCRDKDFYGFMEYYLNDYDRVCKLLRHDPDNHYLVHRVMKLLKNNADKRINYHYFHPDIFDKTQCYVRSLDLSIPVIQSIMLFQKEQSIDSSLYTAIDMTKKHFLSMLSDGEKHVLFNIADAVDPDVWDNVVFDWFTLNMITQIFYK